MALREVYAEAATVCLDKNGHQAGVQLKVDGRLIHNFELYWDEVSRETKESWRDLNEATEQGAT